MIRVEVVSDLMAGDSPDRCTGHSSYVLVDVVARNITYGTNICKAHRRPIKIAGGPERGIVEGRRESSTISKSSKIIQQRTRIGVGRPGVAAGASDHQLLYNGKIVVVEQLRVGIVRIVSFNFIGYRYHEISGIVDGSTGFEKL